MKLAFVTQSLDPAHPTLAFTRDWVRAFARRCEQVTVICREGAPLEGVNNVQVQACFPHHRTADSSFLRKVKWNGFLKKHLKGGHDTIFAHMVPRDAVAAAKAAGGKPVLLWYAHGEEDPHLSEALGVVKAVLTPSADSFPLQDPKVHVVGHGISLNRFTLRRGAPVEQRILFVGRISERKNPVAAILTFTRVHRDTRFQDVGFDVIGGALTPDDEKLVRRVELEIQKTSADVSCFHGAVPYEEMPQRYARATALLCTSKTGSLDKVVLEALACGTPVVASKTTYGDLLSKADPEGVATGEKPELLARGLERILKLSPEKSAERATVRRALVEEGHDLDKLVERVLAIASA